MATSHLRAESVPANITVQEIGRVARALKRLNEIGGAPVLTLEQRQEVSQAKAVCWSVVGQAAEELVGLLDAINGDSDLEANGDELDGTNAEDEEWNNHLSGLGGAGCPVADPGGCEHDGCEPDYDAELETWSHADDHPAELFIGQRPGHTEDC